MSLCPTKDIHSVYLDNEMPLSYIKEYETHVQNCTKCSAELNRIKNLRALLKNDSQKELSKKELDKSFERLQIRMSYSRNTKKANNSFVNKKLILPVVKYTVPAMAAAAVFALVLPVGLKGRKIQAGVEPVVAVNPIAPNTVSFRQEGPRNLSGNIPNTAVATGRAVSTNQTSNIDVFRPNFDNENTISIKITVPGMNAVPYTTEIGFPVDMYKGYLSE